MTEQIRRFQPDDFEQIHRLNALEGWQDLVADQERTRNAWIFETHRHPPFLQSLPY